MVDPMKQPGSNQDSDQPLAHCWRCGTFFECGVRAGQSHCWCFELAHVMKVEEGAGARCLCPFCLQEAIKAVQQSKPFAGGLA